MLVLGNQIPESPYSRPSFSLLGGLFDKGFRSAIRQITPDQLQMLFTETTAESTSSASAELTLGQNRTVSQLFSNDNGNVLPGQVSKPQPICWLNETRSLTEPLDRCDYPKDPSSNPDFIYQLVEAVGLNIILGGISDGMWILNAGMKQLDRIMKNLMSRMPRLSNGKLRLGLVPVIPPPPQMFPLFVIGEVCEAMTFVPPQGAVNPTKVFSELKKLQHRLNEMDLRYQKNLASWEIIAQGQVTVENLLQAEVQNLKKKVEALESRERIESDLRLDDIKQRSEFQTQLKTLEKELKAPKKKKDTKKQQSTSDDSMETLHTMRHQVERMRQRLLQGTEQQNPEIRATLEDLQQSMQHIQEQREKQTQKEALAELEQFGTNKCQP